MQFIHYLVYSSGCANIEDKMVVSKYNYRQNKPEVKRKQKCLRTLDQLPMKYNRNDCHKLTHTFEALRNIKMAEESLIKQISENQTCHSRQLFEDIVNKNLLDKKDTRAAWLSAGKASPRSIKSSPPDIPEPTQPHYHETRSELSSKHSGPTRYGSPLYSRKSARSSNAFVQDIQPKTTLYLNPPSRYYRAPPVIEKTLQRSMTVYKVVPFKPGNRFQDEDCEYESKTSYRPASSYPGFMLIPNPDNDNSVLNALHSDENSTAKANHYSFISWKKNQARNRLSSMFPEPEVIAGSQCGNNLQGTKERLKGCTKAEMNKDSSKGSLKSHAGDDVMAKNPSQNKLSKTNSKDREPKPVEKLTPGRDSKEKNSAVVTTDSKTSLSKQASKNKLVVKSSKKSKEKRGSKENDMSSSSISIAQLSGPQLPQYICPSSEEKSKESRIRHWLCENTFKYANRNVPLV